MGKAAILIISAAVIFGSMYAHGAQEEVQRADGRLSEHQFEVLSRNAALAGYNLAKQELAENFDASPSQMSGTYEKSDFSVSVTRNGSIATIVSTGTSERPGADAVTFTIEASIEKEVVATIAEEAPPFMRYAILTENDLHLNGNILTDLYVDGNEENTLNANMHTNASLAVDGNAAVVKGFGTYVNSASGNPSSALTSSFRPYYNPTNAPVTQQVPTIDVPEFDVAEFVSKVEVDQTSSGAVALSGTYDFGGTREDPYVWYVDGDLSASGGTTLNGYVMFIVSGDVSMSGNLEAGNSGYDGGDESSVAYYAAGAVDLSGNARVYGQIFAGSSVSFSQGSARVYGSLATKGGATIGGSPKIYYREPSPALTTIFEDPEIHLNLVAYSEW